MSSVELRTSTVRKPRRVHTALLALLLLGGLAAALAMGILPRLQQKSALANETKEVNSGEVPVNVVVLGTAGPTNEVTFPGSMQAIQEAPIYARTDGYLKTRKVDIGDRVRAGALLAEIEAPEVLQQLAQARAAMAHAVAAAAQARAAVKQSQSRMQLAQVTLERWKKLVQEGVVSKQDSDEKQSAYDASLADVDALQSNVRATESDIAAQQANVRRLQQLESFQRVVAPFDGTITARNVDPGALITAGSNSTNRELFRMAKTDELRIFVSVPQSSSVAIHPGQKAVIRVAEFRNRDFPGEIVRTADALDPSSRTLLTEIHIPNSRRELRPGMFASVRFSLARTSSAVLAPAPVLVFRADGPHVAIVESGNLIHFAKVVPGRDYGATMEILSGVSAGERAVMNPADDLSEGSQVRVVTEAK